MSNKLYDIHYHALDISHANLLAFLSRKDIITGKSIRDLLNKAPFWANFLPLIPLAKLFKNKIADEIIKSINDATKLKNLLAVIENAIEYHFLYIDYYLTNNNPVFKNITSSLDDTLKFDKIVLCPLLMDFGYKNLKNDNGFYTTPPQKPILNQVVDIFNAINFYYNYQLEPHSVEDNRLQAIKYTGGIDNKLFEIYPFLGINTKNYTIEQISFMFKRYFNDYENDNPITRQQKLKNKLGKCKIDIEEISSLQSVKDESFYNYLFAGIKLYPPLGFDPWPENDSKELDKVKLLYKQCIHKKLPVIVHCSDGGFVTDSDHDLFTNPARRWQKVLENYPELKIDFAHFGIQADGSTTWKECIKSYMRNKNLNVYTDISCISTSDAFYSGLKNELTFDIENKFMFGSDFLINLLFTESYNDYLNLFLSNNYLSNQQKLKICQTNSEKFLFG